MKWTEQQVKQQYSTLDLDPNGALQRDVLEQICAKNTSFKRRTIWGVCTACAVIVMAVIAWQTLTPAPAYLPDPGEFSRARFAFYRDLALPGQDLGISYDDLPQEALERRDL